MAVRDFCVRLWPWKTPDANIQELIHSVDDNPLRVYYSLISELPCCRVLTLTASHHRQPLPVNEIYAQAQREALLTMAASWMGFNTLLVPATDCEFLNETIIISVMH